MTRSGSAGLAACTQIAATQYGLISMAQAMAAGLSRNAIYRLARERMWTRVFPRVFALWTPGGGPELWRHRLAAAQLWLAEGSGISHRASALVWELDGLNSAPIELSTTRDRRSPAPGIIVHCVAELPESDLTIVAGLKITTVARTIIDLASVVPARTVELALGSGLRRRLVTRDEIHQRIERSGPTTPGRATLRALLESEPEVATESALETLVWRLFRSEGLPLPVRQHEIRDEQGRFVARVDFAYPDHKLAIEADGYEPHSGKINWTRDLRRQNALIRLGWTVYRITWDDVIRRSGAIAADLRNMLRRGNSGEELA